MYDVEHRAPFRLTHPVPIVVAPTVVGKVPLNQAGYTEAHCPTLGGLKTILVPAAPLKRYQPLKDSQ